MAPARLGDGSTAMVAGKTWEANITNLILNILKKWFPINFAGLMRIPDMCTPENQKFTVKSKRLRQARHVARMGEIRNVYIIFVVKWRNVHFEGPRR